MNFGGFDVNYSESGVDLIKPAVSPSVHNKILRFERNLACTE